MTISYATILLVEVLVGLVLLAASLYYVHNRFSWSAGAELVITLLFLHFLSIGLLVGLVELEFVTGVVLAHRISTGLFLLFFVAYYLALRVARDGLAGLDDKNYGMHAVAVFFACLGILLLPGITYHEVIEPSVAGLFVWNYVLSFLFLVPGLVTFGLVISEFYTLRVRSNVGLRVFTLLLLSLASLSLVFVGTLMRHVLPFEDQSLLTSDVFLQFTLWLELLTPLLLVLTLLLLLIAFKGVEEKNKAISP